MLNAKIRNMGIITHDDNSGITGYPEDSQSVIPPSTLKIFVKLLESRISDASTLRLPVRQ